MKLVAVTYGTEGDTRPLAALSRALMDAGHEIRLLADRSVLGSAHDLGVPAQPLSGDIKSVLQSNDAPATGVPRSTGFGDMAGGQLAIAHTESWMREVAAAAEGCDAILVSGLAVLVGLSVGEQLGIPVMGAALVPMTPTCEFPSPFLPPGSVPASLNHGTHHFVNEAMWRSFRKAINAARASVAQLPPREAVWKDHAILYGVSPSLVPRPADWPGRSYLCGQWVSAAAPWSAPPALEQFLAAGEPPIYVGFGSMAAGFDWRGLLDAVIAALAGRRAVFYPGWSGVEPAALPANFFVIGDTPHDWLFPRMSAVIHHGGAGTTHSAARAGVPSVVVPLAADQFFWSDRLMRLGVAPQPVRATEARGSALARGIAFAESSGARSNATALGARMAAEDGLAQAVTIIETLLQERQH